MPAKRRTSQVDPQRRFPILFILGQQHIQEQTRSDTGLSHDAVLLFFKKDDIVSSSEPCADTGTMTCYFSDQQVEDGAGKILTMVLQCPLGLAAN